MLEFASATSAVASRLFNGLGCARIVFGYDDQHDQMQRGLVAANLAIFTSGVFGSSVEAGLKVLCLEIKRGDIQLRQFVPSNPFP
ncbi:hypothetical protein ACCQ23_22850 [Xanthomonas axonopodis pv. phyllanthi]|uniref:hypothetical protein n=1 Tax=Xanthomonas axonopodis TaxID=53413 RepID=UPI003558B823